MSSAEAYARWVLDPTNTRRTGQYIKLAAERFLSDLQRTDIYFDEVKAMAPINFIEENLYHWEDKWRGKPVVLEPWQKFIIQQVYGWIIVESGLRRIRMAFIETGKKNSKTALGAFFSLFHLFDDHINSPKIFVGANNHEQANICVNYAGKTIENSPNLYDYIEDGSVKLSKYNGKILTVIHEERDGFIETMAKEPASQESKQAGGKHGKSPSLVIIDEYAMADSDSLLNAMENAQGAREEPLTVCITTSGPKKLGPCYTKVRATGIKVLEGTIIDDSYLSFIFEMDRPIGPDGRSQDITIDYLIDNPDLWQQSNPNHKVSVFDAFLRSQLTKAKNEGGSKEVDVLTFNFNLWVDSPEVFISKDIWNANSHGLSEDELLGQHCYGGLEIASSKELSAMAFLFPGDVIRIKMIYITAQEALRLNEFYKENKDLIKVDQGNVVENTVAIDWIIEEIQKYNMHSFCFFKPQENNSIVQGLILQGYTGNPISQGVASITAATDEWEKVLKAGKVEHFNNPILRWMNSNCLAVRKQAGIRLEKHPAVLGIYACINALAQWKSIEATEVTVGTEFTAL